MGCDGDDDYDCDDETPSSYTVKNADIFIVLEMWEGQLGHIVIHACMLTHMHTCKNII